MVNPAVDNQRLRQELLNARVEASDLVVAEATARDVAIAAAVGAIPLQDASQTVFNPAGTIAAGDVQSALEEVDGDIVALDGRIDTLEAAPAGAAASTLVTVNFGTGSDTASTAVTGLTWVAAGTKFALSLIGEDPLIEGIVATVTDIVAGDGFTVLAYAPAGAAGTHTVHVLGV